MSGTGPTPAGQGPVTLNDGMAGGSGSMSSSTSAGVGAATVPDEPSGFFDGEMLSKLIAAASARRQSDRATAQDNMRRPAELLRVFREERPTARHTFSNPRGGLATWQQKRVAAYVQANISSNIRVIDLARVVRLSKSHFFRAFRESFGEPPMEYVVKRRVLLSQELMRNSRAPLCEIALACGMCDQPHFTRVFHRVVGVSPGLWRRQLSNGQGALTAPWRTGEPFMGSTVRR
jgi:AraC family transcriptional regulator